MKGIVKIFSVCLLLCRWANAQPQILYTGGKKVLAVNGQPFLIMGGELGNSAAASSEKMRPVWQQLNNRKLNTVLAPVYWELLQPNASAYDFSTVDSLVLNARQHNLKLVLLWFGTWKNTMSCYVPAWIKQDEKKYPRVKDKYGKSMEILSAFDDNILQADKQAFAKLLQHIKIIDGQQQTVLMVQVENEIGMLSTAREYNAAANKLFGQPVPQKLIQYLQKNKDYLVPELRDRWAAQQYTTNGNWEAVFGKGTATEELFQAWYYAAYVNEVALAGKAQYNLPMYVNAALFKATQQPGDYPSAGPLPQVMDIWQATAPAIDMLSPDFYNPDTRYWCNLYMRQGNPLFIPEMRFDNTVGAKAMYAIGHYKAIGFSPFAIENAGNTTAVTALQNSYAVLQQLQPLLYTAANNTEAVLLDKNTPTDTLRFGKYTLAIKHDNVLGWNGHKQDSVWEATGAIIIQTAANEFIVAGTGVVVNFISADPSLQPGILSVDKGRIANGNFIAEQRLNGDETHQGRHLRIPAGEWDMQQVKLYSYK